MIEEHDRVVLTESVPEHDLQAGDVGTVVHVYADGAAYEVEFFRLDGRTVAVETVSRGLHGCDPRQYESVGRLGDSDSTKGVRSSECSQDGAAFVRRERALHVPRSCASTFSPQFRTDSWTRRN